MPGETPRESGGKKTGPRAVLKAMTPMSHYDEERIAELLRALPPAPEGWVRAAQELPRSRAELDDIVGRAVADEAFRKALIADLEAALRDVGYEPDILPLDELRRRLGDS
jgi:hypothetical protein